MKNFNDLIGHKFGKLTVIKNVGTNKRHNTLWLCKCECGNNKIVARDKLITGNTKSCGCLKKQHCSSLHKTHSLSNTKIGYTWRGMKSRCYNPKNENYKNYGGRGIKVCDEWLNDFMNFYNWSINNGYKEDLSIDRINSDGNYEPNNCRWITWKEQTRNTRRNRMITYNNEAHCLAEWAEILGIDYCKLKNKINKTKDFQEAINLCKQ